jgi:hypothetical protein
MFVHFGGRGGDEESGETTGIHRGELLLREGPNASCHATEVEENVLAYQRFGTLKDGTYSLSRKLGKPLPERAALTSKTS